VCHRACKPPGWGKEEHPTQQLNCHRLACGHLKCNPASGPPAALRTTYKKQPTSTGTEPRTRLPTQKTQINTLGHGRFAFCSLQQILCFVFCICALACCPLSACRHAICVVSFQSSYLLLASRPIPPRKSCYGCNLYHHTTTAISGGSQRQGIRTWPFSGRCGSCTRSCTEIRRRRDFLRRGKQTQRPPTHARIRQVS
jgi:hypothetical protein